MGCGKTTLCRKFLSELNQEIFDSALIFNPYTSRNELLNNILIELGETVDKEGQADLVGRIYKLLLEKVNQNKQIVLIIDEAQNLPFDVLEQIRLLSNLETDDQKLLQIILMGQPELKDRLKQKQLRQLKQRIAVYYDLMPLTFKETKTYIDFRLDKSRFMRKPQFSYYALRKIFKHSQGIPRVINKICDYSLFSAFTKSSECVKYKDVCRAIQETDIE